MHHFQTPGLEISEIFFLTLKIDLTVLQRTKKMSKADFLFWRLDNKYITGIIKHSNQKGTCGQSIPQGPAQEGSIKQYWKHFIFSSVQNYPSLKSSFCLSPFMLCASPHHYLIQPSFKHSLSLGCSPNQITYKKYRDKRPQMSTLLNSGLARVYFAKDNQQEVFTT